MGVAWVGDDGSGAFSAHVDYDEPGPFCFMNGPTAVTPEAAVAWARRHAKRVIVRDGNVRYSAGAEAVAGLPSWPSPAEEAPRPATTSHPVAWGVQARTGWYRRDRNAVAGRLAEALAHDARAADARASVDQVGFSVSFTVTARSELGAHETASGVAREAWAALHIQAAPGNDFDLSSINVKST